MKMYNLGSGVYDQDGQHWIIITMERQGNGFNYFLETYSSAGLPRGTETLVIADVALEHAINTGNWTLEE